MFSQMIGYLGFFLNIVNRYKQYNDCNGLIFIWQID